MIVIDPGHAYDLAHLDGQQTSRLTFVKREGPMYPGNIGHHEGTNLQEVLRACIDRTKYLDAQIPHEANKSVLRYLRLSLAALESRAAERHGRTKLLVCIAEIELMPTCPACGHIGCEGSHHANQEEGR